MQQGAPGVTHPIPHRESMAPDHPSLRNQPPGVLAPAEDVVLYCTPQLPPSVHGRPPQVFGKLRSRASLRPFHEQQGAPLGICKPHTVFPHTSQVTVSGSHTGSVAKSLKPNPRAVIRVEHSTHKEIPPTHPARPGTGDWHASKSGANLRRVRAVSTRWLRSQFGTGFSLYRYQQPATASADDFIDIPGG